LFENIIFLKVIDKLWENHINTMTELRKSIGLQSYANKDPLVEYKILGGDLFETMLQQIKLNICKALFHSVITRRVDVADTNEEDNQDGESNDTIDDTTKIVESDLIQNEKTTLLQN
jgi:preprotein translocase subunit SecA